LRLSNSESATLTEMARGAGQQRGRFHSCSSGGDAENAFDEAHLTERNRREVVAFIDIGASGGTENRIIQSWSDALFSGAGWRPAVGRGDRRLDSFGVCTPFFANICARQPRSVLTR